MGTLQDRLNGYIKSVELSGGDPPQHTQRWFVISISAGIIQLESTYLLLPVDIKKILEDDLFLEINSKNVDKTCHLCIEKIEGQPFSVKVIYEFKPRWGFKP